MNEPEPARARVLVIEDSEVARKLLAAVLADEGYLVDLAPDGEVGLRMLERELYDIVLLDLNLPRVSGLNVLAAAPAVQSDAQFIVLTAFGSVSTAVEAIKAGAFDYLTKPYQAEELLLSIRRALQQRELRREVAQLRRQAGVAESNGLIGRSAPMRRLFDLMERVAPTRSTVLILGETGTGKELVARAIHGLSPRSRGPFVAVNCSALPETLLESELFGHVKGSFTGAIANRRGLFEEAAGGTLLLDEVSTLSPATQVKLLRVLQERTVVRLGASRPVPVDFRLIAASNVPLAEEVVAGRFREDLYFRLNVVPLQVPPLRERAMDIPLLADHFCRRVAAETGRPVPEIAADSLKRMTEYAWPGNVRELEHFIERAVVTGGGSIRFDPAEHGTPAGRRGGHAARGVDWRPGELLERAETELWPLERLEREYILAVLARTGGHKTRAAELLGLERRTLYRKVREIRALGSPPRAAAGERA
jgi:DNA-binding NtrC family response regulator